MPPIQTNYLRGLKLWAFSGGVNSPDDSANDCQDVLYREDGAVYKQPGWVRKNFTALNGRILGVKGFTYKGKNTTVARPGNYGANDGANHTRRLALYTGAIVLTTTTFYRWDNTTQTFISVALPGGVTISASPRPTFLVLKNNVYVVGWGSKNLRYDPTDQTLYLWGWESVPTAPTLALAVGGGLVANTTYRYAYSWQDNYTGEESAMGAHASITTTSVNRSVNITGLLNYAGTRHFVGAVANRDARIILWRTGANDDTFRFLEDLDPNVLTFSDTGFATDAAIRPFQGVMEDEPKFNMATEHAGIIYATSWDKSTSRVFYSDFSNANFFIERWRVGAFKDIVLPTGELITALAGVNNGVVIATNKTAHFGTPTLGVRDTITLSVNPLSWNVGVLGPRAFYILGGWVHFLGETGPHRWREGLMRPEHIGRDLLPFFYDPLGALCKLSTDTSKESEISYDQDTKTLRWLFSVNDSVTLNRHLSWREDASDLATAFDTWSRHSQTAQAADFTNALGPLVGGVPPTPFSRKSRFVWGDADGYINEADPTSSRGGLPAGSTVTGLGEVSLSAVQTTGGLFTTGDALKNMFVEVVYPDGGVVVRKILSNTSSLITVTSPFLRTATGARWYVSGIPAFWRSAAQLFGSLHYRKTVYHMSVSSVKTTTDSTLNFDIAVSAHNHPVPPDSDRARKSELNEMFEKFFVSATARFFTVEFSNSRPNETFGITGHEWEFEVLSNGPRQET